MSSRKKKTADGRTQAQAGIDAELVEELELRGAHAAVEEGLSGKHAALSRRRFRRCRTALMRRRSPKRSSREEGVRDGRGTLP